MGSRYLFIVLYVWLEKKLSRGDYRRPAMLNSDSDTERRAALATYETMPHSLVAAHAPSAPASEAPVSEVPSDAKRADADDASASNRSLMWALRAAVGVVPVALIALILRAVWKTTPHVPFWDEWATVTLVQHFSQGALSFQDFWQFHNEHRIVIPNIIELALILITRWNRQVLMTFDVLLSVLELALLTAAVRRGLRSGIAATLAFVPLAMLVLSLGQWENWDEPFQITFIMTALGMALCLWALVAEEFTWRWFAVALAGAVIAALSALGGTVALVAFLPAVAARGGWKKSVVWAVVAIGILVPYFQGFPHTAPFVVDLATIEYAVGYLGAPACPQIPALAILIGAGSIVLFLANALYALARTKNLALLLPWLGLAACVVGDALVTAIGRTDSQGLEGTVVSRYQVFSALWWVVLVYLLMANAMDAWKELDRRGLVSALGQHHAVMVGGIAIVVVAMVGFGVNSVSSVHSLDNFQLPRMQDEACVVNYAYANPACLWEYYPVPFVLQQRAPVIESQHLGIFFG